MRVTTAPERPPLPPKPAQALPERITYRGAQWRLYWPRESDFARARPRWTCCGAGCVAPIQSGGQAYRPICTALTRATGVSEKNDRLCLACAAKHGKAV